MTIHPLSLACLSLFFPGSGQLLAGRVGKAFYFAALALFLWVISMGFFGWIVHICAALDVWASETPDEPITPTNPTTPKPNRSWVNPTEEITEEEMAIYFRSTEDPENVVWH